MHSRIAVEAETGLCGGQVVRRDREIQHLYLTVKHASFHRVKPITIRAYLCIVKQLGIVVIVSPPPPSPPRPAIIDSVVILLVQKVATPVYDRFL